MENEKDKIIIDYIDGCLTSVYQPCDVVVNKPLKTKIRSEYYKKLSQTTSKPGDKVVISREDCVGFIERAIEEVNDEQNYTPYISSAFALCGLDPFVLSAFENISTA